MIRAKWTDAELTVLRRRFPHERTDDIARDLGRPYSGVAQKAAKLGLSKTVEYFASPDAHRFDGMKGEGSRFQPGQAAWNKGIKGSTGTHERCRATQFKPGRQASEARNYRPIGSIRVAKDGYAERKITDDPSIVPARRWVAVHRLVWEAANGPIPAGHAVVFRRGQFTADPELVTLDRIELVTRAELMRRNSYHTNYPPEVARLIQLTGAINRQINKRAKHEQEHQ